MKGLRAQSLSGRVGHCMVVAALLATSADVGLSGRRSKQQQQQDRVEDADSLLIVDCLLPPRIRKLGRHTLIPTPRKPIKTSAVDCEIRGGEYVAYDRADYATALRIWLPAAAEGDADAQLYVGEIYEKGLGVAPDYAKAASWYLQASEQGSARAQINLGHLYERGLGVDRDVATAVSWYRRASGLEAHGLDFLPAAAPDVPSSPDPSPDAGANAQEELTALRAELQELRRARSDAEATSNSLREQLAGLRQQTVEDEAALTARETAVERLESELTARETEVTDREEEVEVLRARIEKLQRSREESRGRVGPPVVLAGPTIDIIEPPVPPSNATRVIPVETPVEERLVVGRVDAPAGLVTLLVNDRETAIDSQGIFRTGVPIAEHATKVTVVAIDGQGKRTERELLFELRADERDSKAATVSERPRIDFGNYVALVIGNNEYRELRNLETAINDAEAVTVLLERKYGFSVQLLTNADRYQILSALNDLRKSLTEKDNLLIYYAGHGDLDEVNVRGHWLPVDAESSSTANWISTLSISELLNAMSARHVLVVADSCYSGALTRASLARLDAGMTPEARGTWIRAMAKGHSRTALTSGGLRPVLDGGGGGRHSVFARRFVDVLEENGDVLDGHRLFQAVSAAVAYAAEGAAFEQVPEYGTIQFAGHESGAVADQHLVDEKGAQSGRYEKLQPHGRVTRVLIGCIAAEQECGARRIESIASHQRLRIILELVHVLESDPRHQNAPTQAHGVGSPPADHRPERAQSRFVVDGHLET
jgi:uncharacterized caspase-like protein